MEFQRIKQITKLLKGIWETIDMMGDAITRSGYDVSPADDEKIAEKNSGAEK